MNIPFFIMFAFSRLFLKKAYGKTSV